MENKDHMALPTGGESRALLSTRDQIALSFLWFALNFQSAALLPIIIPAQIILFVTPGVVGSASQAIFLGWLSALGAVSALVLQPIVGALSDRTPGPFGRRRPYIFIGGLLLLAGIAALGLAQEVALFTAGFVVTQVAGNIGTAAYQGLLPDRVPPEQRGAASGYLGLMTILGNVGSLALAALLLGQVSPGPSLDATVRNGAALFYLLTGLVVMMGLFVTLAGVREVPLSELPAARTADRDEAANGLRGRIARLWLDPFRSHNFTWVFLTRGSVILGLTLFQTFILFYFARVAQDPNFVRTTAALALLALLGAVASALALGFASDRIGRVPVVFVATMFMALAALAFVVAPAGSVPLWPLGILFGLGYGAYTSVDWALAVDALPSLHAAGKDLGLWSIASNLPSVVAPLLGALVIALSDVVGRAALGYRAVFALAALFLVLGAVFVFKVREQRPGDPEAGAMPPASQRDQDQDESAGARGARRVRRRRSVGFWWRLAFRTRAGKPRGFLRFWPVWERITMRIHPTMLVPGATKGVLRVRLARFRGRSIELPDGTRVRRGDRIVELHLNNRRLTQVASLGTFALLRMMADDLRALAAWVEQPDFPADVRALHGVTLLSRAGPRLGFTLRARPKNLHTWLERFFMHGLLVLYNLEGVERLLQGSTYGDYPQEIWMSRGELLRRYGSQSAPSARGA
jgi:MFS family permease